MKRISLFFLNLLFLMSTPDVVGTKNYRIASYFTYKTRNFSTNVKLNYLTLTTSKYLRFHSNFLFCFRCSRYNLGLQVSTNLLDVYHLLLVLVLDRKEFLEQPQLFVWLSFFIIVVYASWILLVSRAIAASSRFI